MTPVALLKGLRERGATIRADGGELEIKAAPEVLRPKVIELAREYKPELLELLAAEIVSREYSELAVGPQFCAPDEVEAMTGELARCTACGSYCGEMALCAFCAKEKAFNEEHN